MFTKNGMNVRINKIHSSYKTNVAIDISGLAILGITSYRRDNGHSSAGGQGADGARCGARGGIDVSRPILLCKSTFPGHQLIN